MTQDYESDDFLLEHFREAVDFYRTHEDVEDTFQTAADELPTLESNTVAVWEWALKWDGAGPRLLAVFGDGRAVWWDEQTDEITVRRENIN